MRWLYAIRRRMRQARGARSSDRLTRIAMSEVFQPDDVEWLTDTYFAGETGPGTPWDPLRHVHMALPSWFERNLDPLRDRKSTRLNSSHLDLSRMPSSA